MLLCRACAKLVFAGSLAFAIRDFTCIDGEGKETSPTEDAGIGGATPYYEMEGL